MNSPTIERTTTKSQPPSTQGSGGNEPARSRGADPQGTNLEDLDKIREILFGVQSREHAQHLSRVEDALARTAAELRQDLATRFEALEAAMKRQVDQLTAQIKTEHDARAQSINSLVRDLGDLGKTLASNTAQLDQQTAKESRDLRQRITEQQQALLHEIQQKNNELSTAMKGALDELRSEKVTRAALAELFAKSAQSLAGGLANSGEK